MGISKVKKKNLKGHSYLTTGEFAKMCQVKKQTLFHYDDIGLFSPDIKEDNGYRYYSTSQLELFEVILILKDLDMPLKDIRDYVSQRSPETLIALFEKKRMEIDEKIEDLKWKKKYMDTKTNIVKRGLEVEPFKITLESQPAEYFRITEYTGPDDDDEIAIVVKQHLNSCMDIDIYSSYSIGGMIPSTQVPTLEYYNYSHFFAKLEGSDKKKKNYIKPAGDYAVIYHKGSYDNIYSSYDKLVSFFNKNNYTMGKYLYEIAIVDELAIKGYDNQMIKLSVMINR